jgi:hypothetical protein
MAVNENAGSDWFCKATESMDSALRTTAKLQEETMQWWANMMGGSALVPDWQERARITAPNAGAAAQRTAEEYVRAMNQAYRTGLEFLSKAFESGQVHSIEGVQGRVQTLWDHVLAALRMNNEAFIQAHAKAMESWAQLIRTNGSTKVA